MERTPKLIVGISGIVLITVGLVLYSYFQSKEYLRGPVIEVLEPMNGSTSTSSSIIILGNARNISFISLDGRQIFTDERGRFRELVLLQEGYTILTIAGKDRFGHTIEKKVELVYKPGELTTNVPSSHFGPQQQEQL